MMNDNVDRLLQKHDSVLSQHQLEINEINHNVNIFKNVIQELREKFCEIDALRELYQKFENLSQYVKTDLAAFKVQADTLKKAADDFQLKVSQFRQIQIDAMLKQDEIVIRQERDFQNYNSKLRSSEMAQTEIFKVWRNGLEEAIEKLRKDLLVSPVAVFEQNNQIMGKLESASLDGTNAMLKVNNMDMNIRIIEKKIESLAIQIKKIELQAQ